MCARAASAFCASLARSVHSGSQSTAMKSSPSSASLSTVAPVHDLNDALSSDNEDMELLDESTAAYMNEQHDMLSTTLAACVLPHAERSSIVQYHY